jgi:putative hydrolase of HD superfamily
MRASLAAVLVCAAATARADAPKPVADAPKPVDVVDRQLAAYNAKNLDAFLSCFAPDAELLEFPDKSLAKGTAALRERYQKRFADPILHATIADRMLAEGKVIDHEHVRITWPEGPGTWDAVAIYQVDGAVIRRVWFVFGAKTVDAAKPPH